MRTAGILGSALCSLLAAQTAEDLFQRQVRPVLERECQGCHGAGQTLSRLDLRTRQGLLQGGARGPAIVPGNAPASLLTGILEGTGPVAMPPGGAAKRLPADVRAAFRAWINGGAPWPPPQAAPPWDYQPEDLWAFRPLRPPDPTKTIDAFIQEKLAAQNLVAASRADPATLLRRVTYGLTGLPPKPEEVDAFVRDSSPDAWKKTVERLLASPEYGERWGRHWLDVVRYADTSGYSNDFERPNAWRYRDYVIRSFQNDKPYDRFIREQIAGDELFPDDPEARIATGFLRAGPWEHTSMSVEAVTRQMFLDDVTHATASTFLALTVGCARCHDHKFDPIPTRDYYRLQAAFATTEFARPGLDFLPVENTADLASGEARLGEIVKRTRARMDEYRAEALQGLLKKYGVARPEDLPKEVAARAMQTGAGLSPERFEEYKLYQKHLQIYQESLDRYRPKAFAVSSGPLDGATDGGVALRYPRRADYQPAVVRILPGGNLQSPGETVTPGVLGALERYGNYPAVRVPESIEGRRAAIAEWIAHPENPLTARVMVNRIWQYHFGRGLAANASNFGKMGGKPTHPELLDWLARYFIDSGWSVKAVHRVILLSETYQRASSHPAIDDVRARDPENKLLARFAPRRLDAEEIRDSVLAVAGELSLERGGPGVFPQINQDVARQPQHRMGSLAPAYAPSPLRRLRNRRTIYTFQQRSLVDPLVEVFNGPSMDLSCERREASTVPTQAFALFNSEFSHDMALALAARVSREAPDLDARIVRMFRLAFGRNPEPEEHARVRAHCLAQAARHRASLPPARLKPEPLVHQITSELTGEVSTFVQQPDPSPFEPNLHPSEVPPDVRALADLALVLINSNEFLYVY